MYVVHDEAMNLHPQCCANIRVCIKTERCLFIAGRRCGHLGNRLTKLDIARCSFFSLIGHHDPVVKVFTANSEEPGKIINPLSWLLCLCKPQ